MKPTMLFISCKYGEPNWVAQFDAGDGKRIHIQGDNACFGLKPAGPEKGESLAGAEMDYQRDFVEALQPVINESLKQAALYGEYAGSFTKDLRRLIQIETYVLDRKAEAYVVETVASEPNAEAEPEIVKISYHVGGVTWEMFFKTRQGTTLRVYSASSRNYTGCAFYSRKEDNPAMQECPMTLITEAEAVEDAYKAICAKLGKVKYDRDECDRLEEIGRVLLDRLRFPRNSGAFKGDTQK